MKGLLVSILAATFVVPFLASRETSLAKVTRKSVVYTTVACVLYAVALYFLYPSTPPP